jgi:GTP-binding protein Era
MSERERRGGDEAAGGAPVVVGSKAGTVALIGRPNAGKSTLMNRLLEEKLAIVSDKPQTTRHRLVGILSNERGQMVFHDTPGIHRPLHDMNRGMMQEAVDALNGSDVVCVLIDAAEAPGAGEEFLLELVAGVESPKVVALNKIDTMKKGRLLPRIESLAGRRAPRQGQGPSDADAEERPVFEEIVPISALTGDGCDVLLDILWRLLPEGPPLYDAELLTIHPERFLAAERIREKILAHTHQELPFTTAVMIEGWEDEPDRDFTKIYATILVERASQKKIIIGKAGQMIKTIGTEARHDLEDMLGRRVYLDLHVRHEPDWRGSRRILAELERDLYTRLG